MKKLKKIKNNLIYYSVVFLVWFFNSVPRSLAVFIGSTIGYAAYMVSKRDRSKAERNLKLIYGNCLSAGQRKAIAGNVLINFGKNVADVVRFKKYYHGQIRNLIDTEGMEHFDRVYKRSKGVIAVTGHIGNFELLAAFFAGSGYKAAVIGRKVYDRRLDKILVENRESVGIVNIDTEDSPRKILKALKEGYALGVLIDTDSMRVRSEFIPAFGRLSYTPVGQSILGLKSGAGFVPMACIRNRGRYKIVVKPEIVVEPSGDFEKDVYNITKKCTEALEEIVNENKDQWIWIHNRWLTRPEEPTD